MLGYYEFLVPLTWIEHVASPLPRERSTTELQGLIGAGEGNRTLVISLEGFSSTIELHPRGDDFHFTTAASFDRVLTAGLL